MADISGKKRSNVWMHFSRVNDSRAKCDICKNEFSYKGGSTSNLSKHLKAKHVSVSDVGGSISKASKVAAAFENSVISEGSAVMTDTTVPMLSMAS